MNKVWVDEDALLRVLAALNGPPHHIRELQATRDLETLPGMDKNPIDILIEDLNNKENHVENLEEKIHRFNGVMDGFLKAYPEDIFPEPSKEDYKRLTKVLDLNFHKGFGSALHGAWGRHISTKIKRTLDDV